MSDRLIARNGDDHAGALLGPGLDPQGSPNLGGPFPHVGQPQAAPVHVPGVEAATIILDLKYNIPAALLDADEHVLGRSVPQGIVERLLGDVIEGDLLLHGEGDVLICKQAGLGIGPALDGGQAVLEGCDQPFLFHVDGLHLEEEQAHHADGLARVVADAREDLGRVHRGAGLQRGLLGQKLGALVVADHLLEFDRRLLVCEAAGFDVIDLNFGCPAKTVNRHRGGAVLLDEPETVHAIVAAVRRAVPGAVPVTAKIRLGVRDRELMLDNARGIADAGAAALVVHARTKEDGYRPPAHWEAIAEIRAVVGLPVMANGEIWSVDDATRCRIASGCDDLMLGRGAVTLPALARQVRGEAFSLDWSALLGLQQTFLDALQQAGRLDDEERFGAVWSERGAVGRYKQWLAMMVRDWPEARELFTRVKRLQRFEEVRAALLASCPSPA